MWSAFRFDNTLRRTKEKNSTSLNIRFASRNIFNHNRNPLFIQRKWRKTILICITLLAASLYLVANVDFYILVQKKYEFFTNEFEFGETSIKDKVLGIEFPHFGFNVSRDIEAISKRQYESKNKQFTNYTAKFALLRIRPSKIEYLIWKPVDVLKSKVPGGGSEFETKYRYQSYDRHSRMSLAVVRHYWYPALLKLQNKLQYQQSVRIGNTNNKEPSIIIPLNLFSSAVDVWEPWIKQLSHAAGAQNNNNEENSIFFSYCIPHGYLYNATKYHSYLIPRYYTDPPNYFGHFGDGHFRYNFTGKYERHSQPRMLNLFEKFSWKNRTNKAIFRGSLTNPWRYELFKIFHDNQKFYQRNINLSDFNYATKYNLADYMDVSLTQNGKELQFDSLNEFNTYIINTPILHRVMPTKQLVSELFHVFKDNPDKYVNSLSLEQQMEKFKYVIHIDGWTCAARLPKYFTAGFVVIWLRDDKYTPQYQFIEDWYLNLKPYEHYVPVQWGNNDFRIKPQLDVTNENDLKEMEEIVSTMPSRFEKNIDALVEAIKYLQDNDDIAKQIALNARKFMKQQYTRKMINERIFDVFDHLPIRDANDDGIDHFLQNSPLAKDWKLSTFLHQ